MPVQSELSESRPSNRIMVQEINILNTREVKHIRELLIEDFGYFPEVEFVFLQNNQNKIFLVNRDLEKLNLKNLVIDKIGFYFGEFKDNKFRLSKGGAEFLFLKAKESNHHLKNTLELTSEETKDYFHGLDLDKDRGMENRPLILIFNHQCLGSARYKDKKILNFLPKIYRGEVIL